MKRNSLYNYSIATMASFGLTIGASAAVLEEVVVTAQKREQSVQDVGIAVTAFTGEQLNSLGYTNAQEVTALAPGVSTIQPNGPSNYAIAIRGVAQNDFISNQESPVSIYIDDVYVSQMSAAGFMLFDTERVEILRGPQGTLYGRNATGGLAHYVTRKPTAERNGYAKVTGGEYEQFKFEGALGGALHENIAGRVSFASHHNGGYVDNRVLGDDINNANDYAGRLQFLITPTDTTEVLLNGRYALQQIRTGGPFENVSSRSTDGATGFLTPGLANFNGYRDGDGDVFAGDYDAFGHQDMESYGGSVTVNWEINERLKLVSISDFQHIDRDYREDSDASPIADFNFFLSTDADQWSQELRLEGEMDRTHWVAGFFYLNVEVNDANGAETPLTGVFGALGLPGPLVDRPSGAFGAIDNDGTFIGNDNPYTTKTESWSLFGQTEYDITDQFTGIVGYRFINEDKTHQYANNFVDFQPGFKNRNGNPNVLLNAGTYRGRTDKTMWSAKIGLDWQPTDDLLGYISWNRGVKGGGFNSPLDISNGPGFLVLNDALMEFDEEKLDAYEIGFKASLWGGLARLNGSAFYYDYSDFQAFRIVGLSTFIFNADANSHGFELEFQSSPLDGLDFLFGVGYVDVEIEDVDLGIGRGVENTKPVQSPKWNLNGLLRYQWPMYNGDVAVQTDFQYRSEHFFSLTRAPAVTENGYAVANARLSYTTSDERWEAAVFVNNIMDEEYLVQTFDLATVLGMTEQYYGLPRWVGGSVRFNWD